jgi:hypothetical protein
MHNVVDIRTRSSLYVTTHHPESDAPDRGPLIGVAMVLLTCGGWCQHLYTCYNEGSWEFLIVGAIVSPVGIVHGWITWLGW